MHPTLHSIALSFCLALAACFWLPVQANADPVNEALKKAFESAKQTMIKPAETPEQTDKDPGQKQVPAKENAAAEQTQPEQQTEQQGQAEGENSSPLQAKFPGVENLVIQTGGNGGPTSTIWYPHTGNVQIDAKLKEFAETCSAEYENEIKESAGADDEKPETWGTWEQNGFFTVERPNPDIISITFNIYSYVGGAHGQLAVTVFNYNTKTGAALSLSDLFGDPQKAISIMSEVSDSKLRQSLGEDVEEEMLKDGTEPTEDNFSNLSLLPDGLAIEFQPYQVGPWSIGQQQVKISLKDLADARPNPAVWPKEEAPAPAK